MTKKESLPSFFKISEDHDVVNVAIRIEISKSYANSSLEDFAHHLFPHKNTVLTDFIPSCVQGDVV